MLSSPAITQTYTKFKTWAKSFKIQLQSFNQTVPQVEFYSFFSFTQIKETLFLDQLYNS